MAFKPFDWDETNPGDSDFVSNYPADARDLRDTLKSAWEEEHDTATGWHSFTLGDLTDRNGIVDPVDGQIAIREDAANPGIDVWDEGAGPAAWKQAATLIPAGTKAIFYNDAAPDGWTFDADLDDHVVMLTDTVSEGGTAPTGASPPDYDWDFTGVTADSTDDHVLDVTEMPAHTHDVPVRDDVSGIGLVDRPGTPQGVTPAIETSSTGGGLGHSHGLTNMVLDNSAGWRPTHGLFIKCTKD